VQILTGAYNIRTQQGRRIWLYAISSLAIYFSDGMEKFIAGRKKKNRK
jgi:hypothetical protein